MNIEAIISRFNESIEWTATLGVPVRIYNKGGPLEDAIPLPNIGFEAHTYLHHFAVRYHSLANVTVCLQGDPFPHLAGDLSAALQGLDTKRFSFQPLFRHSGWHSRDGAPHHLGLGPEIDKIWLLMKGHHPPEFWNSPFGGQFAVHRNLIHSRPLKFWKTAANAIVTKNDACAMERFWHHLFG